MSGIDYPRFVNFDGSDRLPLYLFSLQILTTAIERFAKCIGYRVPSSFAKQRSIYNPSDVIFQTFPRRNFSNISDLPSGYVRPLSIISNISPKSLILPERFHRETKADDLNERKGCLRVSVATGYRNFLRTLENLRDTRKNSILEILEPTIPVRPSIRSFVRSSIRPSAPHNFGHSKTSEYFQYFHRKASENNLGR